MSRILRRPMFRGGKVIDSRGTGITSGLMDGGRVGYNQGKLVTGGELNPGIFGFKFDQPFLSMKTPENRFGGSLNFGQSPKDFAQALKPGSSYRNYLESLNAPEEFETELTAEGDVKFKLDEKGNKIPIKKDDITLKEQIEKDRVEDIAGKDTQGSLEAMGITVKDDGTTEFTGQAGGKQIKTDPKNNDPTNTEISPEDLIRENAELFKELLGEASKEDIKKARISDASDYLLKFFEGTQKEGATLGSAAADVAGFATSKDSRTDKAREAKKKTEQTATALAINDYIAGKRSKEDIVKALSLAKAKVSLTEGSTADKILAAGKNRTITGTMIKNILGGEVADGKAKGTKTIPAGQEDNYQIDPKDDEGFYIFEEGTKNVFLISGGVKIPVFVPGG